MPRLVVFTSEDAHYSVKKLAAFLGIGYDNVYLAKVDSRGKMMVSDLETQIVRAIEENAVPLMVSATAGTTVMGAFDPLREIGEVCRKYGLWFHVDAAWGGGALVSRKHRGLLDGVELADSVTWNPHKLLAAPQQCSTLLLRPEGLYFMFLLNGGQMFFDKQRQTFYKLLLLYITVFLFCLTNRSPAKGARVRRELSLPERQVLRSVVRLRRPTHTVRPSRRRRQVLVHVEGEGYARS